jgi:hypothetical protein
MLFPGTLDSAPGTPHDLTAVRRKAVLYTILNPSRAAHYRSDLLSLSDPGGILKQADRHWTSPT